MALTDEQVVGVNVALNEAAFLTIDPSGIDHGRVAVVVRPLSWDDEADEPAYPVVHAVLTGVRRLWASYRPAPWDDETVDPVPLDLAALLGVLDDLGPVDLDGWTHIDGNWPSWALWQHRPSLDLAVPGPDGTPAPAHHVNLVKETNDDLPRTLQLCLWFDDLAVTTATGEPIGLDAFIDGGRRWWTAFHGNDPRVMRTPPA